MSMEDVAREASSDVDHDREDGESRSYCVRHSRSLEALLAIRDQQRATGEPRHRAQRQEANEGRYQEPKISPSPARAAGAEGDRRVPEKAHQNCGVPNGAS